MAARSSPKPPSDEALSSLANEQHIKFAALAPRSNLVKLVVDTMSHIPGLTAKSMLPSLVTAADVFLGPIEFSFVTEVDSQGEVINTGKNVSASFMANVAPTGSAKTYLMNLGPVGLGAATSAVRKSKYAGLRSLVQHIPLCKDGSTPTLLADDSAAYKFKVLESNPNVSIIGEFIDEPDGHLNRLESQGILDVTTELQQFSTGGRIGRDGWGTRGKSRSGIDVAPLHQDRGPIEESLASLTAARPASSRLRLLLPATSASSSRTSR